MGTLFIDFVTSDAKTDAIVCGWRFRKIDCRRPEDECNPSEWLDYAASPDQEPGLSKKWPRGFTKSHVAQKITVRLNSEEIMPLSGEAIRLMNYVDDVSVTLRRVLALAQTLTPEERKRVSDYLKSAQPSIETVLASLQPK